MAVPRFRFSIRSLLIVVVLTAMYASCWPLTQKLGVVDVAAYRQSYAGLTPVMPFVIRYDRDIATPPRETRYYFWLFGHVQRLGGQVPPERFLYPPASY